VDLFCGCGAVTAGLKAAGFSVLAAVDNEPIACETYARNHPEVHLVRRDIQTLTPDELILGASPVGIDLLVVCAPCQPFSSQNRNRKGDARAALILQTARFAEAFRPGYIFFENVPGLASAANTGLMAEMRSDLEALGYFLGNPVRVDAADYTVPQRRLRCIMFASRTNALPGLPPPLTPPGNRRTVRDTIGDLEPLESGQASSSDPMHFAREHQTVALERMRHIPKDGGSRFSLPPELELPCHRGHKGHPDVYGRMRWDDVAPTLTTGCTDITRGRFVHPCDDRAITIREAARLQTFPDAYTFAGSPKNIKKQIGNAVPVALATVVGQAVLDVLDSPGLQMERAV
jgi:DNA (cytosine-5)-methyltransferase 1